MNDATLANYHAIREQLKLLALGNQRAERALRLANSMAKNGHMQAAYILMRAVRNTMRREALA